MWTVLGEGNITNTAVSLITGGAERSSRWKIAVIR